MSLAGLRPWGSCDEGRLVGLVQAEEGGVVGSFIHMNIMMVMMMIMIMMMIIIIIIIMLMMMMMIIIIIIIIM